MEVIDIHIHGGFGINFDHAKEDDYRNFALQAKERGIAAFCPTLTGDTPENLRGKLEIIKCAMQKQKANEAKIIGAHLEGSFLNPKKSGIQNSDLFLEPTVHNFEKIAKNLSDIVKIVVVAPETRDCTVFLQYLKSKNIKIHFGHTLTDEIEGADGICHLFNAMDTMSHKKPCLPIKACLDPEIYTELIADTKHVDKDVLKMTFKLRPDNRIILISDALPIAGSALERIEFCGKTIFANGRDGKGTLGGSVSLLPDIIENLANKKLLSLDIAQKMAYDNPKNYLKLIV